MAPAAKTMKSRSLNRDQTLHKYFSATPLPKSTTKTRPREIPRSSRSPTEAEVIVIDSDNEGSIEFIDPPPFKRRKLTLCSKSSDISAQGGEQGHSGTSRTPSGPSSKYIGYLKSNREEKVSYECSVSTFGQPFLLVSAESKDTVADDKKANTGTFERPQMLGTNSASPSLALVSSALYANDISASLQNKTPVDINLAFDQWEREDDENVPNPAESVDNNEANTETVSHVDVSHQGGAGNDHIGTARRYSDPSFVPEESCLISRPPVGTESTGYDGKHATNNNAFSILMTSNKECEIWKEVDIVAGMAMKQQNSRTDRRRAPFYKIMPGMPIAVDAFKYGKIPDVTAYFLTHAHSDHYTNLSSSWKHGPIYCSEGTANLITHMLSVDKRWVNPLPMDVATVIPNTNGVTVTLIEANHCPGSCLFLFEGRQTVNAGDSAYKSPYIGSHKIYRYLHCGDFRASPRHVLHPAVRYKPIDQVYLDSTYLDPKYTFPPQPLVISACAELAHNLNTDNMGSYMFGWLSFHLKKKTKEPYRSLFVVGTYSIGKERIVKAIAHALNSKVYCDNRKADILRCEGDAELNMLLTSNPRDAMVHLVPLGTITTDILKNYLDRFQGFYSRIIGFRPTGWTYAPSTSKSPFSTVASVLTYAASKDFKYTDLKPSDKSTATVQVYPVPYSEHSSFYELTCFAMSFNWEKMIATVNVGSETSRAKMKYWIDKWEAESKKRVKYTIVPYRQPDCW